MVPIKTGCGLDVHKPDLFVPVHGVLCFWDPNDLAEVRRLTAEMWKVVKNSSRDLILLNRVWTIMREIREEIIASAKGHHGIVADQFDEGVQLKQRGSRMSLIIFPIVAIVAGELFPVVRG